MSRHQCDEDDEMQPGEGFRASVHSRREPAKRLTQPDAFCRPAPWQQHEALLCLEQFDDLQLNAFVVCDLCRAFSGV